MAAPQRDLRARIRQLGGARPPMAATRSELMRDAEKIHSSLISFISRPNTRHSDILNDLPRDYSSIPWKCVYDAGEAYKPTELIDEPWSPRCLDYSRKSWCFTVLPLLSSRRVVRVTVDKTSTWFSDRGRPRTTRNHYYPDDLLVNRLRTKKPIDGILCRMIEITLAEQTPAIMALCRIREDPSRGDVVPVLLEQQQADGIVVILEATDVEIDQPQQVSLAFQHGLDTEANMNPEMFTASNINREIQPGLNIGASVNQMTTGIVIHEPTDMEIGQPQQVNLAFQHGLDTEANMNPITVTASNVNREIQPGLSTGAIMNQMTTASDINQEIQPGLNIRASMNRMTTASDINEKIQPGLNTGAGMNQMTTDSDIDEEIIQDSYN